ncbi:kinase-like domain-containing protein [Haematococcus lacustris]
MGLAEGQGQGRGHGRGPGGGLGGVVLPSSTVLDIFLQLVSGLAALHSAGVAHQDVKPHNILIHRLPAQPSQGQQPLAPHGSGLITAPTGQPPATGMAAPRQRLYRAVLMDFGSAGPRLMRVHSRRQALQLQEEAEAKCTATFRAPELFDVAYPATLDRAAQDVWAAGCTLYALMYGQSPFQLAINQPGSSLALAVLGGHVAWPHDPLWSYPPALHQLVMECLAQVSPSRKVLAN